MAVIANKSPFNIANVILTLSIGILVIVVAVPVLLIFINSFWVDGQFNVTDVVQILKQQETYEALLNSLFIASGVTIMSTCVGTFFAWLVTRTDLPYKGFMKVMFLVPFMLPSFIGALAWKMLLSPRAGYINQFFMDTLGFEEPVFNIYSYAGIMAVETMYLFPFVFIQVCGALERMDPTLEESARISGASLFTITRKITIPLVMPSIVSGALLIMLYSMAHFGTVAVLGIENGIFNIPTLIYERIHQSAGSFDAIRTGTVLATVLVFTAAFIIWLQNKVLNRGRFQIIAGKSFRPVEVKLRGLRMPLLIICLLYIAFTIVLPTATIFLVGGLKTYGLPITWENLTMENYKFILFEWQLTKDAIHNSVSLGLAAAVITMFAGVMISYVIVKMRVRGKAILEFLGMLPFSVPGSVIALGVILAWSGKFGINLYNTVWIILIAYIARYMAFSLKANSAALEQVHDSLVEAARACGASMWQSLKDIVIPLVRPGMIAAFFLIFLPALRELTVSVMLYGPSTRTIGVAIYTLNEDGETVYSAALAGIALIIIVVGQTVIKRYAEKKTQK
ncbi:binding-protein-dependent transport systems inner membrane component [Aggregatibacter actinomycetemcomitans serotype e str. SC1083]|uniref:Binding-protein-dependent transport systems inner membrane component n=1 Tax=Aggregatibacter actinomycetemcomitans serotype e str. SC1083 TaxID=907488 RepID=G4A825_AGGAC|nr:iron ABC transporter permease [Aggregatibacter actinomycetemcomitans]EGY34579.1 binding-protein-dependent transport systems inner membrane component [Aggregatibacter actinomycetemcomitans serotype e str. SC1083]KYK72276.1 AfuB [Aggregatibacter actinomycetemcomitans serotype e str. SA3096]KYK77833.1 AfuB [Aggregatibacter actinomycetemcomitans serotype e str. SC936]KYK95120.1 AfuB [Aggregatibacter actinomycetemcomitans serotype e str. ANH9776]TYB22013.1 iron ABC transporter permease [Aggregat